MELCWNLLLVSLLVSTAAAVRYNCYQCEYYDQVQVEVKADDSAAQHLRKDVLFRNNEECSVRDDIKSTSIVPAGCEKPGPFFASCASGDVRVWVNFTTTVRGGQVPARMHLRVRFRDCYARRRSEEEGCRDVSNHQDLLMQTVRKVVRNRPLKITSYLGDVCLCEGNACNADLPKREPAGGATSLIMHAGLLLSAALLTGIML